MLTAAAVASRPSPAALGWRRAGCTSGTSAGAGVSARSSKQGERRRARRPAGGGGGKREHSNATSERFAASESDNQRAAGAAAPSCHALVLKPSVFEYKLGCVADCLVHLCNEQLTPEQQCGQRQHHSCQRRHQGHCYDERPRRGGGGGHTSRGIILECDDDDDDDEGDGEQELFNSAEREQFQQRHQARKIKAAVSIYATLMKLAPLEAHLQGNQSMAKLMAKTTTTSSFCPLQARQQVLDLIENRLPGYCDSIDLLRCILRSNHMIGAIAAFSVIVERIYCYNERKLNAALEALQASEMSQREFRIVQEWKV